MIEYVVALMFLAAAFMAIAAGMQQAVQERADESVDAAKKMAPCLGDLSGMGSETGEECR